MEEEDILTWSKDYFLKWSDFKAESNPAKFEDSFSFIKFHHSWTVNSEMFEGKIYFVIDSLQLSVLFYRHLSWVRNQCDTPFLLNHEQGHFDLAQSLLPEITANILSEFKNKRFLTRGQNEEQRKQFAREDSGLMISKELENWSTKLQEKRKIYDDETEFGTNLNKQQEYDEQFAEMRK